jgi:carbonic anhydrase
MKRIVNIWFLTIFVLFSCQQGQNEHQKNVHPSQDNEHTIYTMDGLEHGLIQSPVNILTLNTTEHFDHEIKIFQSDTTMSHELINTGHSVKLDFDAGTSIQFDGKTYEFLQAHFHTPSEHQIDGITYPMEMHFVCKENSEVPNYLVVGAFFKMGQENLFISSFIEKMPESADQSTHLTDKPVYIDDLLLPEEPYNNYYHYRGSLTTTPYTELVEWFLMKRILEATPEQIQYINKLEGNNARHVQALFGRKIEQ